MNRPDPSIDNIAWLCDESLRLSRKRRFMSEHHSMRVREAVVFGIVTVCVLFLLVLPLLRLAF